MYRFKKRERVDTTIYPDKHYTGSDLEEIADQLLRDDSKTEICRFCEEPGRPTGEIEVRVQDDVLDGEGNPLSINFAEHECQNGHRWWDGEGRAKGIGGDNPILFDEHVYARKKREIYCKAGMPDPSIVAGIYNRQHPQGRKVNSKDQRKRHGASYYR